MDQLDDLPQNSPWPGPQGRMLWVHRDRVLEIANRRAASNVRVFGSVARGEDTEASDIDLLVDVPARRTLLTLAGLAEELSEVLGVTVEVATLDLLRDEVRPEALRDAIPLVESSEREER